MDKRQEKYELIILTTFDSSLFNVKDESYQLVKTAISFLQARKIPLITITNKTQAEIEELNLVLNLKESLIVEYGSAVLIPLKCDHFLVSETSLDGEYYVKQLGCTYIEARAALKVIQSIVRINNLRGFGDLSETEIQALTGLSIKEVKQAKTREFSEMFVTPQDVDKKEIIATAEEFGFQALIGDNLSCLVGAEASVKEAVNWLKTNYQPLNPLAKVVTVGLANSNNSNNDLEMLEAVDIPVMIANQKEIDSNLIVKEWRTTGATGLAGWVEAVNVICQEYCD
jgi:mannosyl-3-phosphoglycerate phosphatase